MRSAISANLTRKTALFAVLVIFILLVCADLVLAQGKFGNRPNQGDRPANSIDRPNPQDRPLAQERLENMRRNREERQARKAGKQLNNAMGGAFGTGGGVSMRVWAQALRLSPEQIRRMRQIQRTNFPEMANIQSHIAEKRTAIEQAIYSDTVNEENIKQLAGELAKLESQMIFIRIKTQTMIRQVLTPEQMRTLNDIRFGPNRIPDNFDEPEEEAPPPPKN